MTIHQLIAALERDARNRAESRKQISLAAIPYRPRGWDVAETESLQ